MTKFVPGKTYDARRGRVTFTILDVQNDVYKVHRNRGDETTEEKHDRKTLAEIVRLKRKGKAVVLSATQLSTFRRCKRKWGWTYLDGIVAPPSLAMEFGTEVHAVLENYLKTGKWVGSDDAINTAYQGVHTLPEPNPDAKTEWPIRIPINATAYFMGFIDLLQHCIVSDYKTTKDLRYALTKDDLETDVQANIYSKWAYEHFNKPRQGILAHWRYFCARPSKRKTSVNGRPRNPRGFKMVSRLKSPKEINEQWEGILVDAKEMIEAYQAEGVWANDLTPNTSACWDYGGCPFRSRCNVIQESLGALIAHNKIAHLKKKDEEPIMAKESLMDIIKRAKAKQSGATGINPPPVEETIDPELEKAAENPIPQMWLDRLAKGQKPRAADEKVWRAKQEESKVVVKKVEAPEMADAPLVHAPTPAKTSESPATAPETFTLFVDCLPAKGATDVQVLSEVLRPMKDAVAKMKEVPYWNLLEYREGEQLLAACVQEQFSNGERPTGIVLAESASSEWKACGDVLTELADVVVRSAR